MKRLTLIALVILIGTIASAQKKPLDHSVYDNWESVGTTLLSPDGKVLVYQVAKQEGDATLYIRTFGRTGREVVITRGYNPSVTEDGEHVICLVKPEYAKTRQEKIKKVQKEKTSKDSLAIIDVKSGIIKMFPNVKSYRIGKLATESFAFSTTDTTFIPKADRKKKDIGDPLAVYHFSDGHIDTLRQIDKFDFSKDGKTLAFVRKTDKKRSVVGFYEPGMAKTVQLTDTTTFHSLPSFDETGTQALFLQANDTLSSGSKHAELFLYETASGKAGRLIGKDDMGNLPKNWGLTENSSCYFSHDGKRIFAGVQEFTPPKDTTLVPFETPGLDIWTWNEPELPPMMKKGLMRDARRTFPTLYKDGKLNLLQADMFAFLQPADRWNGPFALYQETADPVETQWNARNEIILSLLNVENASRKEIARGALGSARISPKGNYVTWWDYNTRKWFIHSIGTGSTRCLSEGIDTDFWDVEDDHPMAPGSYGIAGWTEGDREILVYDQYDIWVIPAAAGQARRLTAGREEGRTYRYVNTKDPDDEPGIRNGEKILLSIFDNKTKENGLGMTSLDAKACKTLVFGGYSFPSVLKAKDADIFAYRKGNFQEPYDIYYSPEGIGGKKDVKLSSINPQQTEYNWGTAELYHWTAYDGTKLDGILFKPEDFDASRKYPVMIYFYERNSETLYNYRSPAPSRSTVNIPFYVSRGYVVFIPDIVYTPGLPGESAYNCIVSGAESLGQFPWIDSANMAIQGQSWGGYQVAYLITRTGMFKAAGAGAPVSNMTSAYGGIRWASGMSRQFQYEQTQSRIGRDLWHGIELYMENSPLFKLPEVTTPVLIMHNDNDGAVPWYQGIEMFMGLRRLGKPAWLLEYNGEEHNLVERRNCKDLSIRLQQFFDHYLKGAPLPVWMRDGVQTSRKDYEFGYETVEQ